MKGQYCRLFRSNDPFGEPFSERLPDRLLLCPTDGYHLTLTQYAALVKMATTLGEEFFYISEIEGQSHPSAEANNWCFGVAASYSEYESLPLALENIVYSVAGRWAVIISHEEHALFGGSSEAASILKMGLPGWQGGVRSFLTMWEANNERYGSDITWIPRLLAHLGHRTRG